MSGGILPLLLLLLGGDAGAVLPPERVFEAELQMAAELMEAYRGKTVVFLARDAEGLAHMARLYLERTGQGERLSQIVVAQDSRASVKYADKEDALAYYRQLGVTEERLRRGEIVFVDTGFEGSIPARRLQDFGLPREEGKVHLVLGVVDNVRVSVLRRVPNSRVFLTALDPRMSSVDYAGMTGLIPPIHSATSEGRLEREKIQLVKEYADSPRSRLRASGFVRNGEGKMEPVHLPVADDMPKLEAPGQPFGFAFEPSIAEEFNNVDPEAALAVADARRRWLGELPAPGLEKLRSSWSAIFSAYRAQDKPKLLATLRRLLAEASPTEKPAAEAIVRDFIEISDTTLPTAMIVTTDEVGLLPRAAQMPDERACLKGFGDRRIAALYASTAHEGQRAAARKAVRTMIEDGEFEALSRLLVGWVRYKRLLPADAEFNRPNAYQLIGGAIRDINRDQAHPPTKKVKDNVRRLEAALMAQAQASGSRRGSWGEPDVHCLGVFYRSLTGP